MANVSLITHRISGGAGVVGHVTSPVIGAHGAHMSDNATSAQAEIATWLSLKMAHSINTISWAGFVLELNLTLALINWAW